MTCDFVRQLLLALNLDEESRQTAAKALLHWESCEACQKAMRDFDHFGELLGSDKRQDELPGDSDVIPSEVTPPDVTAPAEAQGEETASCADPVTGSSQEPLDRSDDLSPLGGWGAFEAELLAASQGGGRRQYLTDSHRTLAHQPSSWWAWSRWAWARWWLPLGSLAAMVLVGWAAFHVGHSASGVGGAPAVAGPTSGARGAPAVVERTIHSNLVVDNRLVPDEVARKVQAFGEVDQYYNGQTNWLLLSAENSEVGLASHASAAASPTTHGSGPKVLLVRLNLRRGQDVISNADLLIVAGTTASVVVPTKLGVPLQYHVVTSASDPMRLSVRVEIPRGGTEGGTGDAANPVADGGTAGAATAVLGTSLRLEPYRDASAGTLVLERGSFDLQITAAPSDLPG